MLVIVRICVALALTVCCTAGPTVAAAPPQAGIVLMHGLNGVPLGAEGGNGRAIGGDLVAGLRTAGYAVETPEMCWSHRRIYDRAFTDCFADVDAAIARLRAKGASVIVVGGMSMGGNSALAYAATHPGVSGVIACAPAHDAAGISRTPAIAAALAAAQAAVAAGNGDKIQTFPDADSSRRGDAAFTVRATPRTYVSFFDPAGPANISSDLAHVTEPVIWVAGTRDASQRRSADEFAQIPANPLNKYVSVNAQHLDTPDAGAGAIVEWMHALVAAQPS